MAKYIVNYMLPIAKNIEVVKPMFDIGNLADLELAGVLTHRQVRDIIQARVRKAKQIIKVQS